MDQIQKIGSDVIFLVIFFIQGVCSTHVLAQHMLRIVTQCVCVYIYIGHGLILAGIALYILSSKPFLKYREGMATSHLPI
jgi:hypothetical protein